MDKRGVVNWGYILFISSVSALGGLLFGYDWVVIGGAKPFYESYFSLTDSLQMQGWAVSCALIGCIIGAMVAGWFSDKFGRKPLLIVSALLFTLSAVGTGSTYSFDLFVIYRIIGGVGIGIASTLAPIYISEVSPPEMRGRMVSLNQFTIVIGILMAQVANWIIAEPVDSSMTSEALISTWNGQEGWRWMFWAEAIPASLFLVLACILPESPRWLSGRGRDADAEKILNKIGDKTYVTRVVNSIRGAGDAIESGTESGVELGAESSSNSKAKSKGIDLKVPHIRLIIVIGVVLAIFQQWCGINVIFMYAQEIFSAAGYGVSDTLFNIVITGSVNLIFTIIAMTLVDKLGRKKLMLIGSLGLAIIYGVLSCGFAADVKGAPMLILVVMAIACYAMTLAPVTWVILSEIFPNRIRGVAMSVSVFALWSASTVLTYTFPIINGNLGATGSFAIFSIISLLGYLFIRGKLIETKGKSLEEIEDIYKSSIK